MNAHAIERTDVVQIGTPMHFEWLRGIVKWILPLNLADAVFTLWWITTGHAEEGNVFIRDLAHGDAMWFMLAKLTLVSLGILFLWKNRNRPAAVVSIFVTFFAYYLVLLHHLRYIGGYVL